MAILGAYRARKDTRRTRVVTSAIEHPAVLGAVARLEAEIDAMTAKLKPLRSFVLPGGTPAAAALHVARTVCRRAERLIVELQSTGEPVSAPALKYINRLSDHLFVAARAANDDGAKDVLWVPGQNR